MGRRQYRTLLGDRYALITLDTAILAFTSLVVGYSWPTVMITTCSTVLALSLTGLHRQRLRFSAIDDMPRTLLGVAVALPVVSLLMLLALTAPPPPSRVLSWFMTAVAGVVLGRAVGYSALGWHRQRTPGESVVVIGSGAVAIRLVEALCRDRTYGLAPIGFVGRLRSGEPSPQIPLLGPVSALGQVVSRHQPRHLVVTFSGVPDADLVGLLRACRRRGVTVFVVPRLFELALGRDAELIGGVPVMRLRPEPRYLCNWIGKRIVDISGAVLGLVILSPIFAACALAVRWETGRSGVFFRQERVGQDGKRFTMVKFRSLTPADNLESQVRWNITSDSRIGPVGRLLRSTSLDELPQLLNVLRGDMSLVGPRPERPFFVERFRRTHTHYADRHRIRGGITGWAQIHGLRGDTSIEERVRYDNYYIENWSLWLDLKVMIRTLVSMLDVRKG